MRVEISIRSLMDWIAKHSAEIITLIVLGIGQLAAYLKLKYDVRAHGEKIKDNEDALDAHLTSPVLHRTPDFEKHQDEIKSRLDRIDDKLDRALALPRSR